MPPLRERLECIEPLARYLLGKLSRSVKKKIDSFAPNVIEMFRQYPWPGNIRQLSNTIERAILLEDDRVIRKESISLPDLVDKVSPNLQAVGLRISVDQEKDMISNALDENLWIQKDAARQLGITPRALNYRIKKLGITHSRWRKNR
jgi:transcriptional regulator with PAS, ATPase and Fis domain